MIEQSAEGPEFVGYVAVSVILLCCLSHHFYPRLLCYLLQKPSYFHRIEALLSELQLFHRAAELRGVRRPCPLGSQEQFEGGRGLDQFH